MAEARGRLIDALAAQLGIPPLTPAEIESILSLAGVAAHGTGDRTSAPLVSFLTGLAAASSDDRDAVIDSVRRSAEQLVPAD